MEVEAEFPRVMLPLMERGKYRYKVVHGGRGGLKSWSFAQALLLLGANEPLRVLCARETMESIQQSVHQLIRDQVPKLRLEHHYEIEKSRILGRNGTLFTFAGLAHNISNIKSLESYDICWIEEADNVSKDSWETLIPTLRKQDSEIWVSFNPKLATDEAYKRFVLSQPPRAWVCQTSWRDNPWFPDVLREEMLYLKETDHDAYQHVYEGATRSTVEGAVYKAEIARAESESRFTVVPYEPSKPVDTYWDLGYADMVSIWFAQAVGFQYRIVDYLENTRQSLDFYIAEMQKKGYTYGTCVLPWDGGVKHLGTGRSIRELLHSKGFKVRVLPQAKVHDGINAVRTIFHQCWFDGERCADGLAGLRRYQWGPLPANGVAKREPLHDAASHPADAFRALAMHIRTPEGKEEKRHERPEAYRPEIYAPFG